MKPNKERIELLCQELESTKVHQCQGQLQGLHFVAHEDTVISHEAMCVWGIATELALQHDVRTAENPWSDSVPQPEVVEWFFGVEDPGLVQIEYFLEGIAEPITDELINWNDSHGMSFWQIAQMTRATYLKEES